MISPWEGGPGLYKKASSTSPRKQVTKQYSFMHFLSVPVPVFLTSFLPWLLYMMDCIFKVETNPFLHEVVFGYIAYPTKLQTRTLFILISPTFQLYRKMQKCSNIYHYKALASRLQFTVHIF